MIGAPSGQTKEGSVVHPQLGVRAGGGFLKFSANWEVFRDRGSLCAQGYRLDELPSKQAALLSGKFLTWDVFLNPLGLMNPSSKDPMETVWKGKEKKNLRGDWANHP